MLTSCKIVSIFSLTSCQKVKVSIRVFVCITKKDLNGTNLSIIHLGDAGARRSKRLREKKPGATGIMALRRSSFTLTQVRGGPDFTLKEAKVEASQHLKRQSENVKGVGAVGPSFRPIPLIPLPILTFLVRMSL
jgi:hypothetical protein